MLRVIWILLFLLLYADSNAQQLESWRFIDSSKDSILIDSNTLIEGSVKLKFQQQLLVSNHDYTVNYQTGYLFIHSPWKGKELELTYQSLSVNLGQIYYRKPRQLQLPVLNGNRNEWLYAPGAGNKFDLYKNDGLKMNGSISRGLGFGNNQDLVLNANLNLQLAGKLQNDVDVLAAISDDNNPIQPEGNTQQLQDFDRVFVQLSKNNTQLTIGDFEMRTPEQSYFLAYLKRSRGAQVNTLINLSPKRKLSVGAEGALSRGRFARNVLNGIEGNQGPYRLSGPNGELFIIVVSGTEAVYLDGQKLTRGEQNDYIIDYNTGEVTFMPKRTITQYSRIVVEFQFSDKNYARSVFHVTTGYQSKNWALRMNYFTEQDNKNQPFLQNLTDSAKQILAAVGDNLNAAILNTATATSFDTKKILYRLIDTLAYSNVYVYTPISDSNTVYYEVRFSNVGQGKGNYRQSMANANGRVFLWVEPQNGQPQGDYEPVTLLISPKQNQLLSLGTTYSGIKNTNIQVEVAQSTNNRNTFSAIDKGNDIGYGVKTGVTHQVKFGSDTVNQAWIATNTFNYEFVNAQFRPIERYRNVEFDRTWNRFINNSTPTNDTGYTEHIANYKSSLTYGNQFALSYQTSWYNRNELLNGQQHLINGMIHKGKNQLQVDGEFLKTSSRMINGTDNEVRRYKAEYNRLFKLFIGGVKSEGERSLFTFNRDSINNGSYGYIQHGYFVKNLENNALKYKLEYNKRTDFLPLQNELNTSTISNNFLSSAEYTQKNGNRFSGNVTYRAFSISNNAITSLLPERTVLGRLEYDYSLFKRMIQANSYYQIGSGQELRRDYQFVEVLVGQGQYVWKDFNADGVQQLNEFVLAGFADKPLANYIKVFLPGNSFVSTHLTQFNQTLNITPSVRWSNAKGVKKWMSKWSNLSALKIDRKTLKLNTLDLINPFKLVVNDTALISLNSLFRNTLFFNRSNPTFGADYTFQDQRSKILLTNGFEARNRNEHTINTRWNINTSWSVNGSASVGQRSYISDFFENNNYRYNYVECKPKLSYQATTKIRLTALAGYFEGRNDTQYGNQFAKNIESGAEIRYSLPKQGVINAKISQFNIVFNGEAQSQIGYDMLQGLQVGKNTVWNINFQQRLGTNLQLSINYDGRQAEQQRTIHTGRMEARYVF